MTRPVEATSCRRIEGWVGLDSTTTNFAMASSDEVNPVQQEECGTHV